MNFAFFFLRHNLDTRLFTDGYFRHSCYSSLRQTLVCVDERARSLIDAITVNLFGHFFVKVWLWREKYRFPNLVAKHMWWTNRRFNFCSATRRSWLYSVYFKVGLRKITTRTLIGNFVKSKILVIHSRRLFFEVKACVNCVFHEIFERRIVCSIELAW